MNIFETLADQNNSSTWEEFTSPHAATEFGAYQGDQGNIFESLAKQEDQKKENQFGFLETALDVGQQIIKKGASGFTGNYGNLLQALGAQTDRNVLPGQEQIFNIQNDLLDRLNKGEKLSAGELALLTEDDILPSYARLPTSKEAEKAIEAATGIGEGKTPEGRILGRGAEFLGEAASLGGGNAKALATLGGSGIAGQSVRELGGPEALATGIEIAAPIGQSLVEGRIYPRGAAAEELVKEGRKLGLSEAELAPLFQAEGKVATLSKIASKGERTKNVFSKIKERLGDFYSALKNSPEAQKILPNNQQSNLYDKFIDISDNLSKTLAPSPDRKAALDFIETAIETLGNKNVTPEYLMNFWQDINKSVKWNSIDGGKKALAQLKEPISEALRKTSPQLAKDFETVNQLYSKYANISKKLKPDLVDAFLSKAELLGTGAGGLALAQGNPYILAGLASEKGMRILAREMLINPYFQNLSTKLVKNFNQSSVKGVENLVNQAREYLERKHPNEDWEFLAD